MSVIEKCSYLLPGEYDTKNTLVHRHGPENNLSQCPIRVYEPKNNDYVIGIVIVRAPDLLLVDINSYESAVLPLTAFKHGSVPSRNELNRFGVVHARVARADRWAQIELSCLPITSTRSQIFLGQNKTGSILRCSLMLCEKLKKSSLISRLHRIIEKFSCQISANGFVWYATEENNYTMIALRNIFYEHEFENNVDQLIERYHGLVQDLQKQEDSFIKFKSSQTNKTNSNH